MATRKVAKKSASKKPVATRAPEVEIDKDANTEAIESKNGGRPPFKHHAKVVQVQVSVGDYDKRTFEKFVEDIEKALKKVPYGQKGVHVTVSGGYHILDGKVCLPGDFDPKTGTFKKGAVPPSWAGGPKKSSSLSVREKIDQDFEGLTPDQYDRKYKLGKYKPKGETEAAHRARMEKQRAEAADAAVEDFDWDEGDVEDDEKLSAAADESASRAVKRLKSSPSKKRVVKSQKRIDAERMSMKPVPPTAPPKPTAKRAVRRVKK